MTDIVEQARAVQHPACKPLVNELANEIERLREALQEIADLSSVSVRAPHIARRALEPSHDRHAEGRAGRITLGQDPAR